MGAVVAGRCLVGWIVIRQIGSGQLLSQLVPMTIQFKMLTSGYSACVVD